MMTDSATLRPAGEARPSKTSLRSTSATQRGRRSSTSVTERFASSVIEFPRSSSEAWGLSMMRRNTGRTRGISIWWPDGHMAAMFMQRSTAASSKPSSSHSMAWKTSLKRPAIRSNIVSTARAPLSEPKVKSARKFDAAITRSLCPHSIKITQLCTMPCSIARSTKRCRHGARCWDRSAPDRRSNARLFHAPRTSATRGTSGAQTWPTISIRTSTHASDVVPTSSAPGSRAISPLWSGAGVT
mmetsp:Transcript_88041/g.247470  ORF Transcript_88041/g.247470 Transcript_88041/m.247470 type:complete len:242 (+) Transcript_88041:753-1478(+)